MEYHISKLMEGYKDHEFEPAPSDVSAENVKALVSARLNVTPIRKKRRVGRILLMAATIALALSATALAVYQFGVKDLVIGEPDNGTARISVLGWRETPEYQAFVEWDAYETEYNATHEVPNRNDPNVPVPHQMAGAWSPEMADKLDEILAKYDLTLHDGAIASLDAKIGGIDVDAILTGDKTFWGGYVYSDGTMKLEGEQTLSNGETVNFTLFSAVKGTLTDISGFMDADDGYEEWTYTAADGTEVDLVRSGDSAMILADMDRVFASLNTSFSGASGRKELEELADSVRWTELNACEGYTDEDYAAYRQAMEAEEKETLSADAAHAEIGTVWTLSGDFYFEESYTVRGRSSADSGDGSVWLEWTYTPWNGGDAITVRYERPAGDIEAAFGEKLAQSGMTEDQAVAFENVPIYDRTGELEELDDVKGYRDFTAYIDEAADGSVTALWLDEGKDLIFTLTADPGRLTEEQLHEQIEFLLSGRVPYNIGDPMTEYTVEDPLN